APVVDLADLLDLAAIPPAGRLADDHRIEAAAHRAGGRCDPDAVGELQVLAGLGHFEKIGVARAGEHHQLVAAHRLPAVEASAPGASQPPQSSATGNSASAAAASTPTLSPWRTGASCARSRTLRNEARERSSRGSSISVSPHTASPSGSPALSPSSRRYRRGAITISDCWRNRRAKAHRCCARTPRTRSRR